MFSPWYCAALLVCLLGVATGAPDACKGAQRLVDGVAMTGSSPSFDSLYYSIPFTSEDQKKLWSGLNIIAFPQSTLDTSSVTMYVSFDSCPTAFSAQYPVDYNITIGQEALSKLSTTATSQFYVMVSDTFEKFAVKYCSSGHCPNPCAGTKCEVNLASQSAPSLNVRYCSAATDKCVCDGGCQVVNGIVGIIVVATLVPLTFIVLCVILIVCLIKRSSEPPAYTTTTTTVVSHPAAYGATSYQKV